jgi:hypothetical protein
MLKRPGAPVNAPLRFLPRGVGGNTSAGEVDSVSISSALACEKLSRDSCDCVKAVGVSGRSSSSDMGEGMRLVRSFPGSCLFLRTFNPGGGGSELLVFMPPADPLEG